MGENPCTLKNGDPKAPLPPKPTPTIPSSETMSLLSLFSEERCIASREIVIDAVFRTLGLTTRFHEMLPCCETLSSNEPTSYPHDRICGQCESCLDRWRCKRFERQCNYCNHCPRQPPSALPSWLCRKASYPYPSSCRRWAWAHDSSGRPA